MGHFGRKGCSGVHETRGAEHLDCPQRRSHRPPLPAMARPVRSPKRRAECSGGRSCDSGRRENNARWPRHHNRRVACCYSPARDIYFNRNIFLRGGQPRGRQGVLATGRVWRVWRVWLLEKLASLVGVELTEERMDAFSSLGQRDLGVVFWVLVRMQGSRSHSIKGIAAQKKTQDCLQIGKLEWE